jgi:hypothetical protein
MDTDKTDEEAQDTGPAFDDDLDSEVDDFTIEEDDRVFTAVVHPVDLHHFVHASSTVSGCVVFETALNLSENVALESYAWIQNRSGVRSTRLSLSPCPDPWSAHLESASGLPMLWPGLW